MGNELTVALARDYFSRHLDESVGESESIPLPGESGEVDVWARPRCPLAHALIDAGIAENPGVCAAYWLRDMRQDDLRLAQSMDPVLSLFVHLVDGCGTSWRHITGRKALEFLAQAEREVAA